MAHTFVRHRTKLPREGAARWQIAAIALGAFALLVSVVLTKLGL